MVGFGERLKQLRENSQLTQKQLAERIWLSKAAISNYELYERNPSPEILIKIAEVFNVSTDYLLGIEEKKHTLEISNLTDEDIIFLRNIISYLQEKNQERRPPNKRDIERER